MGNLGENLDLLADVAFRGRFRMWLETHYPPALRQDYRRPFRRLRGEEATNWLRLQFEHGWRAPSWPRRHGGMGLSFRKQLIYLEEMERCGVARMIDAGETYLGPTLMRFGSDEQQARHLPKILSCEHMWCQGYSEPNTGSDLASLQTRAVRAGDHFLVSGQKTWTTHATEATHMFALVRTGNYAQKQQGISFLLIDLRTPGIAIRPIVNLAGEEEFCDVFLDEVRVPVGNLVGQLDDGWNIAKSLLGYERVFVASAALAGKALALAARLMVETKSQQDAALMDRFTALDADLRDYRSLYAKTCDSIAEGQQPGPEVSMLKIYVCELLQRICAFNLEIGAADGAILGDTRIGATVTDLHLQLMMSLPTTIASGTSEIQRDILAKTVLALPA